MNEIVKNRSKQQENTFLPLPLVTSHWSSIFSADINVIYRVVPLKPQTTRKNAQLNIEAIQTLLSLILQALCYTSSDTGKL